MLHSISFIFAHISATYIVKKKRLSIVVRSCDHKLNEKFDTTLVCLMKQEPDLVSYRRLMRIKIHKYRLTFGLWLFLDEVCAVELS